MIMGGNGPCLMAAKPDASGAKIKLEDNLDSTLDLSSIPPAPSASQSIKWSAAKKVVKARKSQKKPDQPPGPTSVPFPGSTSALPLAPTPALTPAPTPVPAKKKKAKPAKRGLITESEEGKTLRTDFHRGASHVHLEIHFDTWAKQNKGLPYVPCLLFGIWDSTSLEKKVFDRLGETMQIVIEPILQWGFVGHHLREHYKIHGHVKIRDTLSVRVGTRQTPQPPPSQPELPAQSVAVPLTLVVPATPKPDIPPTRSKTLTAVPGKSQFGLETGSSPELFKPIEGGYELIDNGMHSAWSNQEKSEDILTSIGMDRTLQDADQELKCALLKQQKLLVNIGVIWKQDKPPEPDSFEEYCRLVKDIGRNAEQVQEAAERLRMHAERFYRVAEKDRRAALDEANRFLNALGEEWSYDGRHVKGNYRA